jgi:hypothetical protein
VRCDLAPPSLVFSPRHALVSWIRCFGKKHGIEQIEIESVLWSHQFARSRLLEWIGALGRLETMRHVGLQSTQ